MRLDSYLSAKVELLTGYLSSEWSGLFETIASAITLIWTVFDYAFNALSPVWMIGALSVLGYFAGRLTLSFMTLSGLAIIWALGLWQAAMSTLSLVSTSSLITIVLAIPLGALLGEVKALGRFFEPVLDFMQTMPSFVLLVPAVLLFGVGTVPAVVATVFFALPLPIRLIANGLNAVPKECVEAGEAFGGSRIQILLLIKFPLSLRFVLSGINQGVMMSLSMVIVASMIGAGGLGDEIMMSISRLQVGRGVLAGVAVVILAILIDRFARGFASAAHR